MPTEHGSAIYKDSQPGVDASIVGLLRAAGAIIIGKTVSHSILPIRLISPIPH